MTEIVAFILGVAFKSLATVALGGVITRFANVAIEDIQGWPRVWHYLQEHPGKSPDCTECAKTS